ncbi:hypothetical protein F4X73_13800 [Candidatus Poribacteria bacterium]|nr:hypothetical protein [Candidatus Poribacteria bacterium]
MSDNSKSLYNFGGITAVISGLAMIFLGYWFTFESDKLNEAMHGVGVVTTILLVPTIIATTILLIKDAKNGTLLGIGFATIWIIFELLAHSLQTAPLKEIGVVIAAETAIGTAIESVWLSLVEAMTLIGLFFFVISAVFYGISMHKWGNTISAILFFLTAIASIPTFFGVEFDLHLFIRGITFLFLGGVLIQAQGDSIEEIWES